MIAFLKKQRHSSTGGGCWYCSLAPLTLVELTCYFWKNAAIFSYFFPKPCQFSDNVSLKMNLCSGTSLVVSLSHYMVVGRILQCDGGHKSLTRKKDECSCVSRSEVTGFLCIFSFTRVTSDDIGWKRFHESMGMSTGDV